MWNILLQKIPLNMSTALRPICLGRNVSINYFAPGTIDLVHSQKTQYVRLIIINYIEYKPPEHIRIFSLYMHQWIGSSSVCIIGTSLTYSGCSWHFRQSRDLYKDMELNYSLKFSKMCTVTCISFIMDPAWLFVKGEICSKTGTWFVRDNHAG